MRRFTVELTVDIQLDDELIQRCLTPEWQRAFYSLRDAESVAEHVAFNLIQGRRLKSLDGFADLPESSANLLDIDTNGSNEVRK